MPVVEMPNGDLVQFPDDTPKAEIGQFIESKFPGVFDPSPQRRSTVGEEFRRGLRTSAGGIRTAVETSLAELRGDEVAQREAALAGLERSQDMAEDYGVPPSLAALRAAHTEGGLPAAIEEGVSIPFRATAQQSGPIATMVAGARAGATLMPVPQLKVAAGLAGGFAALTPQFLGFNIDRQVEEQLDQGVAPEDIELDYDLALNAALAQGAIESVGQAFVLGKGLVRSIVGGNKGRAFSATDTRRLVQASERSVLGAATRAGVRGAVVEVPVEVAQQVIERYQAGMDVTSEEALAEYGEAAFLAATVGSTIGGVGGVSERVGSGIEL